MMEEKATPLGASILVFGVPDSAIEQYRGHPVDLGDIVDIAKDSGWQTAREYLKFLLGSTIHSGNAYRIGIEDGAHDPASNMVEGGIDFPLKVSAVAEEEPVRLVYETSEGRFMTFDAIASHLDSAGRMHGPGLIGIPYGGHNGGWIGNYVLVAGVMTKIEDRWTPEPIGQNSKIRLNGMTYSASIVMVYIPEDSNWT